MLYTEKKSVSIFAILLCIGFLEGNLALVFFTSGLVLPSVPDPTRTRSGICSSRISHASQVKKKVFLLAQYVETSG